MASFSHLKPHEVFEREGYHAHKLELRDDKGEEIGYAEFEYYSDPFPFYYVAFISVADKYLKKGFGGNILRQVNGFLDSKGRAGLLINAVEQNDPARSMYERYGWVPVPGKKDWLAYNLPENLDDGRLEAAIYKAELNQSTAK